MTTTKRTFTPRKVESARLIDGLVYVQFDDCAHGALTPQGSPLDAIVAHIQRELKMGLRTKCFVIGVLGVDNGLASRVRTGLGTFNPVWLLKAHDFSGIPIDELRRVAALEPLANRYQPPFHEEI